MFHRLRTLFACLCLGMLASSCWDNQQLKQIVQNHFNALNRHDIKLLVKDYDPDAEITSPAWVGIHNGTRELIVDNTRNFHTSPDLRYDIKHVYFSGDSIITVAYTNSGTIANTDKDMPVSMAGKKYILDKCTIFTVRNNKIVKETTYYDQVAFLRQMGFFDGQQ